MKTNPTNLAVQRIEIHFENEEGYDAGGKYILN